MENGSQPTFALQNHSKVKPHSKYNYNYPCSLTLQSRDIPCHIGVGQYCIHNVNPGLKFSDSDCYCMVSFTKVKKTVKSVGITEYKLATGKILSSHPKTRKLHVLEDLAQKTILLAFPCNTMYQVDTLSVSSSYVNSNYKKLA